MDPDEVCKWCGKAFEEYMEENGETDGYCTDCFEMSDIIFGRIKPIRRGVEILYASGIGGIKLHPGILLQDENIELGFRQMKGKELRYLRVRGGNAGFVPGGSAAVKMPGSSGWITVSNSGIPGEVVLIRYLGIGTTKYNHYACRSCYSLNYHIKERQEGSWPGGRIQQVLGCHNCAAEWVIYI